MRALAVPVVVRIVRSLLPWRRGWVDAKSFLELPIDYLTIAAGAMRVLNVTLGDLVPGSRGKGNTALRNLDHLARTLGGGAYALCGVQLFVFRSS